jgi:hypothetical protein
MLPCTMSLFSAGVPASRFLASNFLRIGTIKIGLLAALLMHYGNERPRPDNSLAVCLTAFSLAEKLRKSVLTQ